MLKATLSATAMRSMLEQLPLAVFVFRRSRLVYANPAGSRLVTRLRDKYRIELVVLLLDHLAQFRERPSPETAALALTGHDNEPFVCHVMELRGHTRDVAISVRELGRDMTARRNSYDLSPRESEVVELVLRGYPNKLIASTLGITPATAKKHLSRIFEKVGVTSRASLVTRFA